LVAHPAIPTTDGAATALGHGALLESLEIIEAPLEALPAVDTFERHKFGLPQAATAYPTLLG
jgi:hypothetical protein